MSRCSTCPGPHCKQIYSVGSSPCRYLFLGAGPGKHEEQTEIVYSGPAGQELDQTYLSRAHLTRDQIHLGNCTLCWNGQDKIPSEDRVLDCGKFHLPPLLDRVRPEVLVLMGAAANKIVDPTSDLPRVRLDMHHGRPLRGSVLEGAWSGWIWPSFEPALGMRDTAMMTPLLEDFSHLGEWLRGEWSPPVAPDVKRDYQLITEPGELRRYLRLDRPYNVLSVDTERHGPKPWSVQFSHTPHTGRMILAEDVVEECLLEELNWWIQEQQVPLILHNAGQDLDILDKLKIQPPAQFDIQDAIQDTMQEAYHQCHLPQGLKALAYRLFGVTMTSWEDVVWPASVAASISWMREGILLAQETLQEVKRVDFKLAVCMDCGHRHLRNACKKCGCTTDLISSGRVIYHRNEYLAGPAEKILRHIITYTEKTLLAEDPYNPWEKFEEMRATGLRGQIADPWEWQWLEELLGPMPILGIGNCDLDQAVAYGCMDADLTGQVAVALETGRQDDRWKIAEDDRDI